MADNIAFSEGIGTSITYTSTPSVTPEQIWTLWNEGNLFSLSVAQMTQFLSSVGFVCDGETRKSTLVRHLEEYLDTHDITTTTASTGTTSSPLQQLQQRMHKQKHGSAEEASRSSERRSSEPETLLDLAQSGFYEGVGNMVPKAFQLLVEGSSADMIVSRVNTVALPGYAANMEAYTLVASESQVAMQSRFSKVLQWCALNMANLNMDGEVKVSVGKLLFDPRATNSGDVEGIVSTYTLQQRMQLRQPYTWVSAVPPSAVAAAEDFLQKKGFTLRAGAVPLSYEGAIKCLKEVLHVQLDEKALLRELNREWVDVQTVMFTRADGPDTRLLLRSRPPAPALEVAKYRSFPIIELSDNDVTDVLPAEHGQLIYLSENETRLWELTSPTGTAITVTETRRQPLIVLRDDEEDARIEYDITAAIPVSKRTQTGQPVDARAIGLELLDLGRNFSAAVREPYMKEYGCA